MESYKQVTVDIPEERLAEFHAFFAKFLAGRVRRHRHGLGEHRHHGRRCGRRGGRREAAEAGVTDQPNETTEV
jgi:hypothetical protein